MTFDYSVMDVAVSRIVEKLNPKAIVVFGSVAKKTANDNSDLDIMVIMETDLEYHDRCAIARHTVGWINIPVDVIVHTPEEIANDIDDPYSFIHEVMTTGNVVYGSY